MRKFLRMRPLLVTCFTIACALLIGCSGGVHEPKYDEPIDKSALQHTQIAYLGMDFEIIWNKDSIANKYVSLSLYRGDSFFTIISPNSNNSGKYAWTIPDTLNVGSNYKICVRSASDSSDFLFTSCVSIKIFDPIDDYEPDDVAPAEANLILPDGAAQMHALSDADSDWFYFEASADSIYTIQTFGRTTSTQIELFTASGEYIAGDNDNRRVSGNGKITWRCDISETYYFKVFLSSGASSGCYQVSVTPYTPIANLVIKHPDSSSVLIAGSVDTLVWESSDSSALISILLCDHDNLRSIASSIGNTGRCEWNVPWSLDSSKSFRIRISDAELPSAEFFSDYFSISLRPDNAEPDNSPDQATAISAGTSIVNRTATADDSDWFSFTADSGRTYLITTTGATDMRLTLYGQDGMTIIKSNDDVNTYVKNAQIVWTCTGAGTYYFMADGFTNTTTGLYGLLLNAVATPAISVRAPAPSCTTGTTVQIPWQRSGYTGDVVRIELLSDTAIRTISFGAENRGYFNWSIGQDIETNDNYFIKVTSVSDTLISSVSPVFRIVSVADQYEPDNSMGEADTSIVFGMPQEHTLPPIDSDWVAFRMTAGHSYSIGICGISSVYLSLHRPDGSEVAADTKYGPSTADAKIRCICTETGMFYACVRRYYNNFDVSHYSIVIFEE